VEDTGVLRLTCRAGTPREQAVFVNNAIKHGIAYYEDQKKSVKLRIFVEEKTIRDLGSLDMPESKRSVEDSRKLIPGLQQFLADLSEVVVLDLAEVPPK
jgi:hypothetical protein